MTATRKSPRRSGLSDSVPLVRELPAREYRGLRLATVDLYADLDGQRRAAKHTRVGQGHLSRYVSDNPDCADYFMPIDVVADLEANASEPFITRRLAEMSGYELVKLPVTGAARTDEDGLLNSARETTEAIAEAWKAKADGRVTDDERDAVHRQVREAVVALLEFDRLWMGGVE